MQMVVIGKGSKKHLALVRRPKCAITSSVVNKLHTWKNQLFIVLVLSYDQLENDFLSYWLPEM